MYCFVYFAYKLCLCIHHSSSIRSMTSCLARDRVYVIVVMQKGMICWTSMLNIKQSKKAKGNSKSCFWC